MKKASFLQNLTQQLCAALPESLFALKKDAEKNFRMILQQAFSKLDWVTREEFDAQTKVLARSRKKIEELEKIVTSLEKKTQR